MNIAILGLGTIGSGVYELLKDNKEITVKRILDLNVWMDIMTDDINDILSDDSITAVVETMGGLHPAREYALQCLKAGKSYISANKLLISECARELQAAADESGAALLFSASTGGGIPFLYNLKKTKATDKITELGGILNGTSNYILDNIFSGGASYADALLEAQKLGYAERDPSSDVEGFDTLRKLILSCAVGFDVLLDRDSIPCYGISAINDDDVAFARANNAVIRLTASGKLMENGEVQAYVIPRMLSFDTPESAIRKNINYAWYRGERIGTFGFSGQGAGKYPTANNIVRDLYCVLQGEKRFFPETLKTQKAKTGAAHRFYLRVNKDDFKAPDIIESCREKGEYAVITTKPIGFDVLKDVLKDQKNYFVMLLEA